MHGQAVRQDGRATKLRQWECLDQTGLKVGVKESAIRAHRRCSQGEVSEDILANEFRDRITAIDETAGDGDAIVVVVFQRRQRPDDRIDEAGWNARTATAWGRTDGSIRAIEQEVTFLDRPTVIAASRDDVNLLDIVLADVSLD